MDEFEQQLRTVFPAVERYVHYRLNNADAEDVVQEVCLTAYRKYGQRKDSEAFRSWIISIARNKCNDYFRRSAPDTVPLEDVPELHLISGRQGLGVQSVVADTMQQLARQDRQILELYFWQELPQSDIAARLGIPVGTVKSRLHHAKNRFKDRYPYPPRETKGAETVMGKLPKYLPEYSIEKMDAEPFSCKWEELMGYFMVPKQGEQLCWGIYDIPSRKCSELYSMRVTGKARVHGIDGIEIIVRTSDWNGKEDGIKRVFVVQLTETHCRYLAALRTEGDVRNYITFLDSDLFMPTWGYGDNNCGHETNLNSKGDIIRKGNRVITADKQFLLDVVGRYAVKIKGKVYDTVCLMDLETSNPNVFSEQYIDPNGRTVLWRRFNRDDWAMDSFGGKRWSEQLPDNERITVNGETYVHWYDCISDYIL